MRVVPLLRQPRPFQEGLAVRENAFLALTMMISVLTAAGETPAQEPSARRILLNFRSSTDAVTADRSIAAIELVESRPISTGPQQQRDPQLSPHHFVVVAVDEDDQELSRTVIADPRFVRGETTDPSGDFVSTEIVLQQAKCPLVMPDDPRMRSLRIFQPVWTGEEFVLNPIDTIDIPDVDDARSTAEDHSE
jgi:hypothetical protein